MTVVDQMIRNWVSRNVGNYSEVIVNRGETKSFIEWIEIKRVKILIPKMSNKNFEIIERMMYQDCTLNEIEQFFLNLDELKTVKCHICGYRDTMLRWHLNKEHAMNSEEYRNLFPGAKTQSSVSNYKRSKSCALKKKEIWKDPNSVYHSAEYRNKLSLKNSERLKVLWDDPYSPYNDPEYLIKCSEAKKKEWKTMSVEEKRERVDRLHKFENQFGKRGYALDGHYVASNGELEIDNWLFLHNIEHTVHPRVEGTHYYADFLVDDLYIEYDGFLRETDEDWHGKLSAYEDNDLRYLIIKPYHKFEEILERVL